MYASRPLSPLRFRSRLALVTDVPSLIFPCCLFLLTMTLMVSSFSLLPARLAALPADAL